MVRLTGLVLREIVRFKGQLQTEETSFREHLWFSFLDSPFLCLRLQSFFSSTFQLAGGAHGGLVMTLYLPSSCCLTCCSGLRGDSLALASNTFHETLLCPLFHSSFGRCHWHIAAILFSVYFCPWWRWVGWKLCYFPPFLSWLAHGYKRILFNSTTIHPVTTLFSVELWMGIVFIKVSGKWHSIWFLLQQKTQWENWED